MNDAARQERAFAALDVPGYFGFNVFETVAYHLVRLFRFRRESRFARRIIELMRNTAPLDDFSRGTLLGMLDAWHMSGEISSAMHVMLQIRIQDRKFWVEEDDA